MKTTYTVIAALCASICMADVRLVDPYTVFTSETNQIELAKLGVEPGQGKPIQWFIENGSTIIGTNKFSKIWLLQKSVHTKNKNLILAINDEAATDKDFSWNFYIKSADNVWSNFIWKIEQTDPEKASLYKKYKSISPKYYSVQDAINYINIVGLKRQGVLDEIRTAIAKDFTRQIKIYLRTGGGSFVTTEGQANPMESYMKSLETALNQPYWNGLEDVFSGVGLQISFDRSKFPTEQKLDEYLEKVLIDDLDMKNHEVNNTLRFCLGSEEYNKFVDKYNYGENGPPKTND